MRDPMREVEEENGAKLVAKNMRIKHISQADMVTDRSDKEALAH